MLTRPFSKYINLGYTPAESEHLMILEYRGIGYYKYRKEIEYIVQAIKHAYDSGITDLRFDINSVPGCNIPFADSVVIIVDNDFYGIHGEYCIENSLVTDENNNLTIPPPNEDPNYDCSTNKLKEAIIKIHLYDEPDKVFPESKYRQTIAHELVHLRDDYEIRKSTNNSWSLVRIYAEGNVDIERVMSRIASPIANLIYRLFIDTEWHALASQMYADLYSLYKNNGNHLDRKTASADMKSTETMKEYNVVKEQFESVKEDPMLANKAIVFFPKWSEKAMVNRDEPVKKKEIFDAFRRYFIRVCETRLKDVFTRIVKAVGTLYDDIEDKLDFTFESYKKKSVRVVQSLNEAAEISSIVSGNIEIPNDETDIIFAVDKDNSIVPINVRYNKFCFEKITGF